MKTEIHPEYVEAHVRCTCGNEFTTRSTSPRSTSRSAPTATRSTRAGRSWSTPAAASSASSAAPPSARGLAAKHHAEAAPLPTACRRARPPSTSPSDAPSGSPASWAQRDAPVGGQAVLEGVMMRGVSTWAVAVRKPLPEQIERRRRSTPSEAAARRDRGHVVPARSPCSSATACCACRSSAASSRSASRWRSASRRSASPPTRSCPRRSRRSRAACGRARRRRARCSPSACSSSCPVGLTSLDQGPARLVVPVLARRGRSCARDLPRLHRCCSRALRDLRRVFEYHGAEHKTISCYEAGLPLTPENAQRFSRLHPRCGTSFLLIVMIVAIFVFAPLGLPAWYWLVAVAHPRRPADRRHLVRDHQVRRQQPPPALGARGHVARPAAAEADHARARPRPARGRDRRLEAVLAVENPASADAEELVGIEVVA